MDVYDSHNDFLICPYNDSHVIQLGIRFQRHLKECRKNHPDVEEATCPFNSTHRVKKPELKYHLWVCPDADDSHKTQMLVVKATKRYEPQSLGVTTEPISLGTATKDENWDDDLLPRPVEIGKRGWDPNLTFINPDRLSGLTRREKRKFKYPISK